MFEPRYDPGALAEIQPWWLVVTVRTAAGYPSWTYVLYKTRLRRA